MPGCAILNCRNTNSRTKGTDMRYFRFPKDRKLSKLWKIACCRKDRINLKNACICSVHFQSDCFEDTNVRQSLMELPKNMRTLKFGAVPTLHLPDREILVSNCEKTPQAQVAERIQVEGVPSNLLCTSTKISHFEIEHSTSYADFGSQTVAQKNDNLKRIRELEWEKSNVLKEIEAMKKECFHNLTPLSHYDDCKEQIKLEL